MQFFVSDDIWERAKTNTNWARRCKVHVCQSFSYRTVVNDGHFIELEINMVI